MSCTVPFLDLVHLRERACASCGSLVAPAGSRSFIVDVSGLPVDFALSQTPQGMTVRLLCENGHETLLNVPGDAGAEAALMTPDDAPIAADATLVSMQ